MRSSLSRLGQFLWTLAVWGSAAGWAAAQTQFDQKALLYGSGAERGVNWQSQRGVPLSDTSGNGSDGRNPMLPAAPTPRQFQGVIAYGGVTAKHKGVNKTISLNPPNLEANASVLDWPRSLDSGGNLVVVLRAQVGAPFLSRQATLLFGGIIAVPATDAAGVALDPDVVAPVDYWYPRPYETSPGGSGSYYWSPHAAMVFATKLGPIEVTWRSQIALTNAIGVPPPGFVADVTHAVLGSRYYPLRKESYVVSGQPAKKPRLIYWTEGDYATVGRMVAVPSDRVQQVHVLYTADFPELVAKSEVVPGNNINSATDQSRRTLAFANGFITAYNKEGRVFVELLGEAVGQPASSADPQPRRFLGYEIVDVIREATPDDVTIELGDRVTAFPDNDPPDTDLVPSPLNSVGPTFVYQQFGSDGRLVLWATRETSNLNDYRVHWLESGVEGLLWPARFSRYRFVWPNDPARYSHYVRPTVATEEEAAETSVTLPPENIPTLEYEDPSDRVRARLLGGKFYTYLDGAMPRHRSLLRYNVGTDVAFERVFSVLESAVKSPDFDGSDRALDATSLSLDPGATAAHALVPLEPITAGGSPFTLEAWVYLRSVTSFARVLEFGRPGTANDRIVLGLSSAGLSGRPFLTMNGANGATSEATGPDLFPMNRWAHLAAVYDDVTGEGTLYVDGNEVARQPMERPRGVVSRTLNYLGSGADSGVEPADARFDTVRIWSVARTREQLLEAMRLAVPAGTPGLLAQYLFHEDDGSAPGSSTIAEDSSGAGKDLTLVGAVVTPGGVRPRSVESTGWVGQRLAPPAGEAASAEGVAYLAGHVHLPGGTPFSVTAYIDPFVAGFAAAAKSSIIPVNASNNTARLEVWWCRTNSLDASRGFKQVIWPSVIARYTLSWPVSEPLARDLVLASNAGSGELNGWEVSGHLYVQNDRQLPGYNPNEEHALLQGGRVWALRDDLNLLTDENYSSHPYALLEFTDSDGRPSISAFRIVRETGTARFDYPATAGTILQGPMPLPLLEPALVPPVTGQPPKSYNAEAGRRTIPEANGVTVQEAGGYSQVTVNLADRHFYLPYEKLALQDVSDSRPVTTRWLFTTNSVPEQNQVSGVIASTEPFVLQPWTAGAQPATSSRYRYRVADTTGIQANAPALVAHAGAGTSWVVSVVNTNLVDGQSGVTVEFAFNNANANALVREAGILVLPLASQAAGDFAGWQLAYEAIPEDVEDSALRSRYARYLFEDRKGGLWVYRGPHRATDTGKLVMQFYYRTLPGFVFPALADDAQPPAGTLTPYLRPRNSDGTFAGDPVYGDVETDAVGDLNPLGIVYRPAWPEGTPVLQMAESLTLPRRGLPSVRGQTSLAVLYQQPQALGGTEDRAVVLHDPTRERVFALAPEGDSEVLDRLPDSVRTSVSRGRTYFPNLPPHLVERFYFDPNRGARGALVFQGEFKDEALGDDYLLLNVISPQDQKSLQDLCLAEPSDVKSKWDDAIQTGLATVMERFIEDPARPGTYKPDDDPVSIAPGALAEVTDSDIAVDSYALTAVGPGTGYVTLVAGNGRAFTPPGEPVSLQILRVTDTLYRGELKVVASANPLSEKITVQQVVDLAGLTGDYDFEWRIAAPVDGAPPPVYRNTQRLLLGDGLGTHVRHPLPADRAETIHATPAARTENEVTTTVVPLTLVPFSSVSAQPFGSFLSPLIPMLADGFVFELSSGAVHRMAVGNRLVLRDVEGRETFVTVTGLLGGDNPTNLVVAIEPGQAVTKSSSIQPLELYERTLPDQAQSFVFREFQVDEARVYSQYYLSLDLDPALGARVYVDGQLVVTANLPDPTPTTSPPPGFSSLPSVYRIGPEFFAAGTTEAGQVTHRVALALYSSALPGAALRCNVRLEAYEAEDQTAVSGSPWIPLDPSRYPDKVRTVIGEGADVRALGDNYVIAHYRANQASHASFARGWSRWTEPALAEGWIKRVLAGINPFNQRVTDLFNNRVDTDVSLLTQAGPRWEGDVALNLENINDYGLIEIYETVLRRGRSLSIDAGINYGPANDALLLAAGYLNDLYLAIGNEALADASNPTIGIGTKDHTYGDIATALFAFKGQVPSLLEEELALLRGHDDFLQPGVEIAPVYNRLVWNYTRGIDAGEVIYAVNYNIQENNDSGVNGVIDADDARRMFPQGHGDAYGHYLTAVKGYYSLLIDPDFDWVPRIEAVNVLGKPVAVDYQDERKFAAAAAALARTGRQVFDLTWRRDFDPGSQAGWAPFEATRQNLLRTTPTTRYWGADHWASRTVQGAYLNWAVGNAILPAEDTNPAHEGIQKVDRTTVPELEELAVTADGLQTDLDNAEARLTPLGLPAGSLAFDINPNRITGANPETHFEQIYERAKVALNNALAAFDDAKDVTRLMRSEQDSLAELQAAVAAQELAFTNALIELYGTPYPEDIGPGKTYRTGYEGPDLVHYAYVEITDTMTDQLVYTPNTPAVFNIDIQNVPSNWDTFLTTENWIVESFEPEGDYQEGLHYLTFEWGPHGFFGKPSEWTGRRKSPGQIQQAISEYIHAHDLAYYSMAAYSVSDKQDLDKMIQLFNERTDTLRVITAKEQEMIDKQKEIMKHEVGYAEAGKAAENLVGFWDDIATITTEALPDSFILGTANGGDPLSGARSTLYQVSYLVKYGFQAADFIGFVAAQEAIQQRQSELLDLQKDITTEERALETKQMIVDLGNKLKQVQGDFLDNNTRLRFLDDAKRRYAQLLAQGDRIQAEREIARRRAAALIQGYRTRDAAFRIFRNEKLERYKTLFDLAARYVYLAATAYDYETGLLDTPKGREFLNRIVSARALGVMKAGEPQYAGSNTGDPGLSSVMAEMKADWDVLRGRLGFNNPDGYGTTASLRGEHFRLLASADGDVAWKDVLHQAVRANLLEDADVRRQCLQIAGDDGLPVPGLVLEFSTTIANGYNLFGQPLAAGDHALSPTAFATKLYGVGVAFEGYQGMDVPSALAGATQAAGGVSPPDPDAWFLGGNTLAANPYVYLIPVGTDSLRTPPLGDASGIRTWWVNDVTVPLPFNVGASDLSTAQLYRSADSLSEPLFGVRKHQAFRPVPTALAFTDAIYGGNGGLQPSQYTNRRLVGRSAWNSKWKLVVPGRTLLANPNEGLARFIDTVRDVKLHFITYSYSGN